MYVNYYHPSECSPACAAGEMLGERAARENEEKLMVSRGLRRLLILAPPKLYIFARTIPPTTQAKCSPISFSEAAFHLVSTKEARVVDEWPPLA